MMHPISPRVVVVVLAALGLVGVLARPAVAADWSVSPAGNQFGAGREDYRHTVNPGGVLEDAVLVANTGTASLSVTLRADAPWVNLDRDAVTVAPGATAEVPFAVELPRDAEPGDRLGGIVATAGGSEVQLPIHLRVGGALTPRLTVEQLHVQRESVSYTVRNTGNVILGARQSVSVSGPLGVWSVKAAAVPNTRALLPGASQRVTVPIEGAKPAVRLTATVSLIPLLTDAAGSTAPLAAVATSGHGWALPWTAIVLAALCVLVAIGVASRRSSNRADARHGTTQRGQAAADTGR